MTIRELMGKGGIVLAPGIYDALSGLIATQTGAKAVYLSGASLAYTRFGRSDIGLVSVSEVNDTLAAITDRIETPVIVDADNGFGNALNTQRTVRYFERAGAAAIQLEDQSSPKRCGHLDGKKIIPCSEMVGKVKAALDARRSDETLIIARTDARAVEGLEAAMDRAEAYQEAGADVLFVEAPQSIEEMQVLCGRFAGRVPLLANMVEGEKRILKLVVKTDVRGSLEAIVQAMSELGNDEVAVQVLGSGVGGISESDATMAATYGATVFGFNVRADKTAKILLEREGVEVRYYSVIYELIDDVKAALSGTLSPEIREEIVGTAEVRDVFRSPRFGQIAGCMVIEGTVYRNKPIRVLRDNVVIYEGELESLRRFKDDVSDVRNGTECGIGVRNYNDVRAGDLIEVFDTKEIARSL